MDKKSNKHLYIYVIVFIIIVIALFLFIFKDKIFTKSNNNNTENDMNNNVARLAQESNVLDNNEKLNEVNSRVENVMENSQEPPKEEEIASYSTKLGGSTENRLKNIKITCDKLNGKTVDENDTFSFCKSTGPSTAEEGYKEATVFLDGKKVQALGGGNCQVSSTLYNAILAVPELKVTERHEHGRDVSYVPDGKDAAVSYGSIDFKFKNNTGKTIKLYFSTDDVTLSVRIVKLV